MNVKNSIIILGLSLFMLGCSSNGNVREKNKVTLVSEVNCDREVGENLKILFGEDDPLGGMNRRIYYFNGMADRYVLKPAVTNYEYFAPNFFQEGMSNFFTNFKNISTALNSFLQLKFKEGFETVLRFGINSTIGILGIFDPATSLKIPQYNQNFGRTLAYYGVPKGTYVVAPFLGPSNVRDLSAYAINSYGVNSLDVYHPVDIDFSKWYVEVPKDFQAKVDLEIFFLESDHVFEYEYMRLLAKEYLKFQEKQNKL